MMGENQPQITPLLWGMSLPCVVLGGCLLFSWWLAPQPSFPESWKFKPVYVTTYELLPVLAGGVLAVGVLSSLCLGWVLYNGGVCRVE